MIPYVPFCSHRSTSEPDERGAAICFQCGEVVQVRITRELLRLAYLNLTGRGERA